MRCFQFMGLTGEAKVWLLENCETEGTRPCPHCGFFTEKNLKIVSSKHVDSFYEDGPDLHTYQLTDEAKKRFDGETVKEVIQAEPWSSGPVCFLCLELENGIKIGEWPQEVIDGCAGVGVSQQHRSEESEGKI